MLELASLLHTRQMRSMQDVQKAVLAALSEYARLNLLNSA